MTRIAGAIVLALTVFVSLYVPLESFAMQRRMKIRERRRGNLLQNPLISRYRSKPGDPSSLGLINLQPKVSSFVGVTVRPLA
jgi:hypothetical protein